MVTIIVLITIITGGAPAPPAHHHHHRRTHVVCRQTGPVTATGKPVTCKRVPINVVSIGENAY